MDFEELYYIQQSIANKQKQEWEIMRVLAYNNALPYIDDKKKSELTPAKFLPFPWDKKQENAVSNTLSKEEIDKKIRLYTKSNKEIKE